MINQCLSNHNSRVFKHTFAKVAIAGLICLAGTCGASGLRASHASAAQNYGAGCHTEVVTAVTHRISDNSVVPNVNHQITVVVCPSSTPGNGSVVPLTIGPWRGWTQLPPCGYGQDASATMNVNSAGNGTFSFQYYNTIGNFYASDDIDRSWGGGVCLYVKDPGVWHDA